MPLLNYSLPESRPDGQMALTERQLLQSVVEIARHVFGAAASSVFLVDGASGELVFEAVAGHGADELPGTRFAPGTGIVGWVASSAEPMYVEDLAGSDTFAVNAARSTGYVPDSLMAAPLIRAGDCIGVLEVLDPVPGTRGGLADLDLLGLLSAQAAIGLDLLVRARRADPTFGAVSEDRSERLERIRARLAGADESTATLADKLLNTVEELLSASETGRR